MKHTISVLHATYQRPGGTSEIRHAWISTAHDPSRVQFIVAMDEDDLNAIAETTGDPDRVISPASETVTAVRNWNAAASMATGDLLATAADDLYPPQNWDRFVDEAVGPLDPNKTAFALKVSDSLDTDDTLLRHPIVSRSYYDRFGLFWPEYSGVYCDQDLTLTAYWRAFTVDCRTARFDHRHPTLQAVERTVSHRRINERAEYDRGLRLTCHRWTNWQRRSPRKLVPPGLTLPRAVVLQRYYRADSFVRYWMGAIRRHSRVRVRPGAR